MAVDTVEPSAPPCPVGIGAVGLGGWGRTLAEAYRGSELVDLVTCYSPTPARRSGFAADFGCLVDDSLEALLARPEVEGVIVAVPNDQHAPVVEAAIAAGKHVFVEKPVAIEPRDLARITRAVEGSDRIFACGHTARRLAGIRELKRLLDSGALGAPSTLEAVFGNERGLQLTPGDWRADPAQSPGGPLTQVGIHHIDNVQYLLGPVRSVFATGRRPRPEITNQLAVGLLLEFDSATGYLGADWMTPGTFSIDMHCSEGRARYDLDYAWWGASGESDAHSSLNVYTPGAKPIGGGPANVQVHQVELEAGNHLREEVEEFAAAIAGAATVEVGLDVAVANVAVLLAAVESLRVRRPVDVAEVVARIEAA